MGGHIKFGNGAAELFNKHNNLLAKGIKVQRMYLLDAIFDTTSEKVNISTTSHILNWTDWHNRFGHIGITGLKRTYHKGLVTGFTVDDTSVVTECEACVQAKLTHAPFPKEAMNYAKAPGDLTHTDLWESHELGLGNIKYFIIFIDDYSHHISIGFLKRKDEAAQKCKEYCLTIEQQYHIIPCAIRMNNGHEYLNKDLQNWCLECGIQFETTAPHSPEQNGVAERMNRTLAKLMHAMIIQ